MSINIHFIYIFLILLIFNFSFINNTPRPLEEAIKPETPEPPKLENELKINNLYIDFLSEWEEKMQDFNYDYLYYIPINPREQEIYFENVSSVPTTFKGAFFLPDETTNKIEFYIKDSYDKIIHKAIGHHNLFEFNITKQDIYSITFRNNIAKEKVVITFSMNTGQNNILVSKDLTNTEKKMDALEAVIKKFNMEFKLSRDIHTQRYKSK